MGNQRLFFTRYKKYMHTRESNAKTDPEPMVGSEGHGCVQNNKAPFVKYHKTTGPVGSNRQIWP